MRARRECHPPRLDLGLRLFAGILTLVRLRRRWAPQLLDGVPVLVSHDLGPAVVAWPRPAIVLPAWAVALPTAERTLILLHEREHLRAGDAWLRLGASRITAAIPWNPVAWFLARRLATAIEVDCDARVLRAHPHRRRYAELLLAMAGGGGAPSVIPALSEGITQLERRIDIMHAPTPRHARVRAALFSAAAPHALRADTVFFEYQVDSTAAIISAPAPRYPDALRAAKTEGQVLVQFVVGLDSVADMGTFTVLKSSHGDFTESVRTSLPAYRFTPARRRGVPVKQLVQMPFVFSLARSSAGSAGIQRMLDARRSPWRGRHSAWRAPTARPGQRHRILPLDPRLDHEEPGVLHPSRVGIAQRAALPRHGALDGHEAHRRATEGA